MQETLLRQLDANYLDSARAFSGDGLGEYTERRNVAISCAGAPSDQINFGFLKPPTHDLRGVAESVRTYFAARELPFTLRYRGSQPPEGLDELLASGWKRREPAIPGMVLEPPARVPDPPPGLTIRPVETQDDLTAFGETAFEGFGYPREAAKLFLGPRVLDTPQVQAWSGFVDGNVVATSLLLSSGAIGGIYWVSTLEPHRGKGYGEALTWAAVAGARERGCTLASLQASQMGRPIYARMGFAHVLDYENLVPNA